MRGEPGGSYTGSFSVSGYLIWQGTLAIKSLLEGTGESMDNEQSVDLFKIIHALRSALEDVVKDLKNHVTNFQAEMSKKLTLSSRNGGNGAF